MTKFSRSSNFKLHSLLNLCFSPTSTMAPSQAFLFLISLIAEAFKSGWLANSNLNALEKSILRIEISKSFKNVSFRPLKLSILGVSVSSLGRLSFNLSIWVGASVNFLLPGGSLPSKYLYSLNHKDFVEIGLVLTNRLE